MGLESRSLSTSLTASPNGDKSAGGGDMSDLAATDLLGDLRKLIEGSRQRAAVAVNRELILLYWQVGTRIRSDLLDEERAPYGRKIVSTLSRQLVPDYGRGFSRQNLYRMMQFAEAWPDAEIVSTLSGQLSWSHVVELLILKDPLAREFYAEICRLERWSVRTLRAKIGGMLFERTALSKKPVELVELELDALRQTDRLSPDLVFRDPYLLDFLGLRDHYSERDLEAAILRELEAFILELGTGFTFVARQKRMVIGGEDFYLDLLFYHRDLRRLVAIELKLDHFKPSDKGQVELYLRWLSRYEQREGEDEPIGLILCAEKNEQVVELLELDEGSLRVASYFTELPPRELLERKLHDSIRLARARAG